MLGVRFKKQKKTLLYDIFSDFSIDVECHKNLIFRMTITILNSAKF